MSNVKQLAAKRREGAGKGAARAIRREGRVPAVIYGAGQPPVSISLDFKDTNKLIYAGHFLTTIFKIDVEGTEIRAIPRDYQLDKVRDTPMHVDFLRLAEGSTVRVEIPVHVVGQARSTSCTTPSRCWFRRMIFPISSRSMSRPPRSAIRSISRRSSSRPARK
jgi:large subunit ribosomal protein L25